MTRIERLSQNLLNDAECALITSNENRRYLTGVKSSAGVVLCFREKAYLLIDFRYIEKAKATAKNCEVILLDDFYAQISKLLDKHKVNKIAVEANKMTLSELANYKNKLKQYEFDTSNKLSKVLSNMRVIKDDFEIEKIKQAQSLSEKAFLHILNYINVDRTERDIAMELERFMLKNGAEAISFETIVLSGKNTSMPHGVPSNKKIEKNEFVLMDFGAVVDGYHADMTRTICVGSASEKMEEVYNIVLEAQTTALNNVKSGISGMQLDGCARDVIEKYGYGKSFGHSLGHGVGIDIHELPSVSYISKTILENNMLVTVEPGIYLPNEFGVRIEDLVVIKDNSCINLNKSPKKLIKI